MAAVNPLDDPRRQRLVYDLPSRSGGNTGINPGGGGTLAALPQPPQAATPGAAPNPGNQRDSFHYANLKDHPYRNIPGFIDWANDPNVDPNAKVQEYLAQQRASGGPRLAEDDAGALAALTAGTPAAGYLQGGLQHMPGFQFDDPYTKLFEEVLRTQLDQATGRNAQVEQLMNYINSQFQTASQSPGYTPQQMAVLNTQAFEPIERMRQAAQQRTIERSGARGMLPSSGLIQGEQAQNDRAYDQLRTVANRDLAINQINRQDADRARALQLATLGVQIPQQQNQQALNLANLLYQLPRNAMMDAASVVNASSPQAALSPYLQLLQQQQIAQQQQQAQDAAFWQSIGQMISEMFT